MAGANFDASRKVCGIIAPTLVIHGADDRYVPSSNAYALARAIPGAELLVFYDAGHLVFIERAEGVNEEVVSFLLLEPRGLGRSRATSATVPDMEEDRAWRSGASEWNEDERERYANDPEVLLSVEDDANQQKGDKGPEAWKPPNQGEWCDYATRWVSIKGKYDLSVNEQEKESLKAMLSACGA